MPFFDFRQNNSGGSFTIRDGLSVNVIIEADSADDANSRAENIGIYFNGCDDGRDCSCCGDRWYAQSFREAGDPVPSLYGTPLVDMEDNWGWAGDQPEVFVHLKDGRVFGFHLINGRYVYKGNPEDLVEVLPEPPKAIG